MKIKFDLTLDSFCLIALHTWILPWPSVRHYIIIAIIAGDLVLPSITQDPQLKTIKAGIFLFVVLLL